MKNLLVVVFLASCIPLGDSSVSGAQYCGDSASGQIYGQWKKIRSNRSAKSTADLAVNWDQLVLERGGIACELQIKNKGFMGAIYRATFEHDPDKSSIRFEVNDGQHPAGGSPQATYMLGSNCDSPELTLSYSGGLSEVYEYIPGGSDSGVCFPATTIDDSESGATDN